MARNTELVFSHGPMVAHTKVSLPIITLRVMVAINGQMAAFIKAIGKITKCMAEATSFGQTAELIKVLM